MMPFSCFTLLHFHALNFGSPTCSPAHDNFLALSIVSSLLCPQMHHGTPQDMESDPDDEVNVTLHHHTKLLLLSSLDFALACVAAAAPRACVRACVA